MYWFFELFYLQTKLTIIYNLLCILNTVCYINIIDALYITLLIFY